MANPIDVDQLVSALKDAATGVLQKDVATLEGYSERQVQGMAQQAKWIASAYVSGEIDDDLRDFFLNGLKDTAKNFANTLEGLVLVTIEKVWNAVVGVLWDAIGKAIGTVLPVA